MRISITDRCNLRCRYCMPAEGIEKVPMSRILTYEQILRICRAAAELGISRFKVTGGEPLVRLGCASFCRELKRLPGVEQVTLTTNGQRLGEHLPDLLDAGIDGINISLDSLQADRFRYITGGGELDRTLEGIRAAADSGIRTKINCLLQQGFNEDELEDFAELAFTEGIDVRFIELMPIGFGNPDTGLSNRRVLERLRERYPDLRPEATVRGNGPAVYYRRTAAGSREITGNSSAAERRGAAVSPGAIGLISAMHDRFCGSCNRIRLTSQGQIKPCLCFGDSIDLKPALADGNADLTDRDAALKEALRNAILAKPARHTFEKPDSTTRQPMMAIGG